MKICAICGNNHYNNFEAYPDSLFIYNETLNRSLCKDCEPLWISWKIEELTETRLKSRDLLIDKVRDKIHKKPSYNSKETKIGVKLNET